MEGKGDGKWKGRGRGGGTPESEKMFFFSFWVLAVSERGKGGGGMMRGGGVISTRYLLLLLLCILLPVASPALFPPPLPPSPVHKGQPRDINTSFPRPRREQRGGVLATFFCAHLQRGCSRVIEPSSSSFLCCFPRCCFAARVLARYKARACNHALSFDVGKQRQRKQ